MNDLAGLSPRPRVNDKSIESARHSNVTFPSPDPSQLEKPLYGLDQQAQHDRFSPRQTGTSGPTENSLGDPHRIGPGLIIAGSIVGSGELIATTKTGAEAGFWLLWLILIGCIIKVFVQVELGRYTVSSGETTMLAMNHLPGPRLKRRGNWVIWYWFIMFVASIAQLGGIVGGVGQALSISAPLTQNAREYNQVARQETKLIVDAAVLRQALDAERRVGGGGAIDPESASYEATVQLLTDQFNTANYFFEKLLDLPDEPLEDSEDEETSDEAVAEEVDPLAPLDLTLSERRADLRSLMEYCQQLKSRLEVFAEDQAVGR